MGKLTTHVLDTSKGKPAAGVQISLFRRERGGDENPPRLSAAITNSDGRCDAPLVEGEALRAGTYDLVFEIGDYFARDKVEGAAEFLDEVVLRVVIADPAEHYHVPLLVSPFGYSTYRGS